MSLDVYLTRPGTKHVRDGSGIFVREDGRTIETTREEWERRYPGLAPVIVKEGPKETEEVFSANITHNLGAMAEAAGLYQALWRPEEIGVEKAAELGPLLHEGLKRLIAAPAKFRDLNPANGWGSYEGLCDFVRRYLRACGEYPDAEVSVWR